MSKMKPSVVNFDGERWYYRKRELVGFTVKYGKVSGFSSKEEACAARDASDAAFQAQLTQLYGKHPEDVLFVDFMIFWVYQVYFPTVSYATQSIYDYVVHSYILQISDSAMKLLSVSTKIINDMLVRASKRSNTAAEKVREVLNSVFNGAIAQGLLAENPVENSKRYRRDIPDIKLLSKDELHLFLNTAKNYEICFLEILLALFGGLRRGEIAGLHISDFDFERETVFIQRQLVWEYDWVDGKRSNGHWVVKPPKTESGIRILTLPSVIFSVLRRRIQRIEEDKRKYGNRNRDSGYISCNEMGYPREYSFLTAKMKKICLQLGLSVISAHDLRHMFATFLVEKGESIHYLSALMGHKSEETTFVVYCGIMEGLKQVSKTMNTLFSESLSEGEQHAV